MVTDEETHAPLAAGTHLSVSAVTWRCCSGCWENRVLHHGGVDQVQDGWRGASQRWMESDTRENNKINKRA